MDVLTLVVAGTAAIQSPAPAAEQPQAPQICRRVTGPTGSRLGPRRVCKTAAEWAATARSVGGDIELGDGLDPRAHNPQTGDTGGMGGGGPR